MSRGAYGFAVKTIRSVSNRPLDANRRPSKIPTEAVSRLIPLHAYERYSKIVSGAESFESVAARRGCACTLFYFYRPTTPLHFVAYAFPLRTKGIFGSVRLFRSANCTIDWRGNTGLDCLFFLRSPIEIVGFDSG